MYLCHVAVCGCYLGKLANYSKCTVTFIIVAARGTAVVTGLSAFQLTTVFLMSMHLSCLFYSSIPHQVLVKLFPFLCLLNYTFYLSNLNFFTNRVFSAAYS